MSANRAKTPSGREQAASPDEHGSQDFAALLLPKGDGPATSAPVATAPDTATAASVEPSAATPDQWLALLAGALAQPVAMNTAEPDATPVAPAGIPSSLQPQVNALPTAPAAIPGALAPPATASTVPTLADALAATATGAALPAADPSAADPALNSGSDAKPAFETILGGLNAPAAPMTVHAGREAAPPPPPLQMPTDAAAGFDDGIGTHIAWMAGQKLGEARIQVSPEHLGPIEVTLKLDDARVDAHFHSTHVEVRAALEASVPRLREMLAQHGLQLGQADVGQRQWSGSQPQAAPARQFDGGNGDPAASQAMPAPIVQRRGLLDEYA